MWEAILIIALIYVVWDIIRIGIRVHRIKRKFIKEHHEELFGNKR